MKLRGRKWIYLAALAAVAGLLLIAFRPSAVAVETSAIVIGPLEVTTEDQGETRSHDRFVVAAPVAGRLRRVLLREGDMVTQGQLVATIAPLPLSAREREELIAGVAAAEATLRSAQAQLAHVLADLAQAKRESARLELLFKSDATSRQEFEQAQNAAGTLEADAAAASYRAQSAAGDLQAAKAGLVALTEGAKGGSETIMVRAPATGHVLRVVEPSERVVGAGTPILVVGDLQRLEVVLEMLSTEAVKVAPGMSATLVGWGGERPLRARVRMVEPYGFTKVSALGVEEKRTYVILDFVDPPGSLGDGYRVTGRIVLWRSDAVLKAPLSALFRCGESWCVFVIQQSRARRHSVTIGHRSMEEVEVLAGLATGDEVVRHPPNELDDGMRVQPQH